MHYMAQFLPPVQPLCENEVIIVCRCLYNVMMCLLLYYLFVVLPVCCITCFCLLLVHLSFIVSVLQLLTPEF